MNFRNEWLSILENANKQLEKHGAKIIVTDDEGVFSVQIRYADGYIDDYAENYYENELEGCITDALASALKIAVERKNMKPSNEVLADGKALKKRQKEHFKAQKSILKETIENIHDMCMVMGGEIFVDTDIDSSPLITYDGGSDAENNSTICGVVTAIRATKRGHKKGFEVDLEREDNYSHERMTFEDVCQIYDYVYSSFEDYIDENNGED